MNFFKSMKSGSRCIDLGVRHYVWFVLYWPKVKAQFKFGDTMKTRFHYIDNEKHGMVPMDSFSV